MFERGLHRRRHRRWIAWMALAAMLFLAVVPVVSRVVPMSAAMPGMAMDCTMGLAHAGHQPVAPAGDPDDPTAKCAYCSLLAHTPVVSFDVAVALAPAYLPSLAPPVDAARVEPTVRIFSAAPRGPPHIA